MRAETAQVACCIECGKPLRQSLRWMRQNLRIVCQKCYGKNYPGGRWDLRKDLGVQMETDGEET